MLSPGGSDSSGGSSSPPESPAATQRWYRDKTTLKIYFCHTISSWGDRMWSFAIGVYMFILYQDSLLLTAIYGFTNCLSGIIFIPYIGGWIDKTSRITAARCSVIVQNLSVVIGAIILTVTLFKREELRESPGVEKLAFTMIIFVAIVGELASAANKIALEKDWIVVLARGDTKKLAKLNSVMRTINLTTFILAPIVIGAIIDQASPEAGAIFVAIWNLLSAFVEYSLLSEIYKVVPELSTKAGVSDDIPFQKIKRSGSGSRDSTPPHHNNNTVGSKASGERNSSNDHLQAKTPDKVDSQQLRTPGPEFEDVSLLTPGSTFGANDGALDSGDSENRKDEKERKKAERKLRFCMACDGCRNYFSHHVVFAGLGLASLYMTVLGFDSVTTGFFQSQGVTETYVGVLTAIGAVLGILGSISFPYLRRKLGKNSTGILGFSLETLCLVLCVISIFLKGSPFEYDVISAIQERFRSFAGTKEEHRPSYSGSEIISKEFHVVILASGIILARYGLWIADLTVTQIFQEEVEESQRGIINGVQDSLNRVMDLIKFFLVILFPAPKTFGILIFLSWFFVLLGTIFFFIFTRKDLKRKAVQGELADEEVGERKSKSSQGIENPTFVITEAEDKGQGREDFAGKT